MKRCAQGLVAMLLVAGCHRELEPQAGVVLEGFRFGWQSFNHRLSYLEVEVGADQDRVGVIGGTSTTNQYLDPLADGCDPASCKEFPAPDTADVEVHWASLSSTRTALASAQVALEVGRDGATGEVRAALPEHAPEVGTAVLSGFALSTWHELSGGAACYRPEYGWHPRRIQIAIGDVTIDGDSISAPIHATFSAGNTFDPDRVCIDEVNEQAIVDLEVAVTFLAGDGEVVDRDLVQGAQFPFSGDNLHPEEQVDPSPIALDFGFAPTAIGFAAVDFTFDPENTEDRGAYLRTLSFTAAPKSSPQPIVEANATATNYSPITQLTDFGYRFDGVVRAVDFELSAQRGTTTASLPAKLDADGNAVVSELDH